MIDQRQCQFSPAQVMSRQSDSTWQTIVTHLHGDASRANLARKCGELSSAPTNIFRRFPHALTGFPQWMPDRMQ
jgi:hypothetical protein